MATRIGVDVGGTFTDLIFYDDETGEVPRREGADHPAAPEEGVLVGDRRRRARASAWPRRGTSCTARPSG